MRVLVLHNAYRHRGGEDVVVQSEIELLRSRSVEVTVLEADNDSEAGWRDTVRLGVSSSWSRSFYRKVRQVCTELRPDIAHVHNFWMRLSPAVHYACHELGIPTVQTLHNFRLLCVRADFLRQGKVCQDCLGHTPWRGVVRRCYHDSFVASTAVAGMISTHRFASTWQTQVDAFIALSEHSKSKFIEGGIPQDKIFVKPNFLNDSAAPEMSASSSNVLLFVGRLSEEKGLSLLLRAWRAARSTSRGVLRIIGDGPLRNQLERDAAEFGFSSDAVQFTGSLPPLQVMQEMGRARALALPSLCFENCPRTLLEAFCNARPVLVPNRGSLDEMVTHETTGFKFAAAEESSLADAISTLMSPAAPVDRWGQNARREYLSRYTPAANFERLLQIYEFAAGGIRPSKAFAVSAGANTGFSG